MSTPLNGVPCACVYWRVPLVSGLKTGLQSIFRFHDLGTDNFLAYAWCLPCVSNERNPYEIAGKYLTCMAGLDSRRSRENWTPGADDARSICQPSAKCEPTKAEVRVSDEKSRPPESLTSQTKLVCSLSVLSEYCGEISPFRRSLVLEIILWSRVTVMFGICNASPQT